MLLGDFLLRPQNHPYKVCPSNFLDGHALCQVSVYPTRLIARAGFAFGKDASLSFGISAKLVAPFLSSLLANAVRAMVSAVALLLARHNLFEAPLRSNTFGSGVVPTTS